MKNKEKKYTKIWGEHIDVLKFLLGVLISVILLIVALLIAPDDKQVKLIYGLVAVIVSFFINIVWIKPKRNIIISDGESNNDN
ncbi:MAG: hypothetical protein RBQ97_00050 [Acholeplasma sp.]|nr:hypothetical protein [Acholeplasma sp.]